MDEDHSLRKATDGRDCDSAGCGARLRNGCAEQDKGGGESTTALLNQKEGLVYGCSAGHGIGVIR